MKRREALLIQWIEVGEALLLESPEALQVQLAWLKRTLEKRPATKPPRKIAG